MPELCKIGKLGFSDVNSFRDWFSSLKGAPRAMIILWNEGGIFISENDTLSLTYWNVQTMEFLTLLFLAWISCIKSEN